nr:hypothetical protein [Tanacetum cinerariifolium]
SAKFFSSGITLYQQWKLVFISTVQSSSAVASLCISSGNLSSLAVGSYSGSGNSSLPVEMPCAFYSQYT